MKAFKNQFSEYNEGPYSAYKIAKLVRQIEESGKNTKLPKLNISLMGTTTLDFLKDALVLSGYNQSVHLNVDVLPSEQIMQQLLKPSSALYSTNPDIVVILARIEDLYPPLFDQKAEVNPQVFNLAKSEILNHFQTWIGALRQHSTATVLLHTLAVPEWSSDILNEVINETSIWRLVQEVNLAFLDLANEHNGIYVINDPVTSTIRT